MICTKCGNCATNSYQYCERCEEIFVERSIKRTEWQTYHDEPCPEIELPQFPKMKGLIK